MYATLTKQIKTSKITGDPVVILPLSIWKKVEGYMEDIEILESKFLRDRIKKARTGKNTYSSSQVKKILGIV